MEITAGMVKELRDSTGAGLMDCRKALSEANGDVREAEKILKKMGLAAVAKRADRATENGRIAIFSDDRACVMISVACETDFVAKNEDFRNMCDDLAKTAAKNGIKAVNEELEGKVKDLISVIKENMAIKKLVYVPIGKDERVSTYVHGDGAMGAVVKFSASSFDGEGVAAFMHDVALHVTAYQPQFLDEKQIDDKFRAEQLEIFKAQVATLDKPDKVKEGIVNGKMSKLKDEICLLDQKFVKDQEISVATAMKKVSGDLKVVEYHYMKAGV